MSKKTKVVRPADNDAEVAHIKKTVGTLINWLAQTAGGPINHDEAVRLLKMLDGE